MSRVNSDLVTQRQTKALFYENAVDLKDEGTTGYLFGVDRETPSRVDRLQLSDVSNGVWRIACRRVESGMADRRNAIDDDDIIESIPLEILSPVNPSALSRSVSETMLRQNSYNSGVGTSSHLYLSSNFPPSGACPNSDPGQFLPPFLCRGITGSLASTTSLPSFVVGNENGDGRSFEKFRVTFFNKFGKKGSTAEGLKDASSVTHVYNGAVLVTDMLGSKLVLFSRSGRPEKSFVTGEYTEPWSAVLTPRGHVAVTLRRHNCIAVWSGNGDTMAEFGHEHLRCPTGLAVDKDGRFIVTDEQSNKVLIFSPNRVLQFVLGEEAGITFEQPRHVCLSTAGRIIVSDSGHHCVKIFDREGNYVTEFGEFGSGDGQFKFPYGVCVDQDGHIIVADHYNDRVSMFHEDGSFVQHLVTAKNGVKRPRGVAVRCAHNRKLYVTHGDLRATEVLVYRMTLNGTEVKINIKCFV